MGEYLVRLFHLLSPSSSPFIVPLLLPFPLMSQQCLCPLQPKTTRVKVFCKEKKKVHTGWCKGQWSTDLFLFCISWHGRCYCCVFVSERVLSERRPYINNALSGSLLGFRGEKKMRVREGERERREGEATQKETTHTHTD